MFITNRPNFNGGLETLCGAKGFLTLLAAEAGTGSAMHHVYTETTTPFYEMASTQADKVATLDLSNPEVAKIHAIWKALGETPSSAEQLLKLKDELETWVGQYKSVKEVPLDPRISKLLEETSIVFVENHTPTDPPNAYDVEDLDSLEELVEEVFSAVHIEQTSQRFIRRVERELMMLLALTEGREMLADIVCGATRGPISILQRNSYMENDGRKEIRLGGFITSVYECPNRDTEDETIYKSLSTPKVLGLAHELLHLQHYIQRGVCRKSFQSGSEDAFVYSNPEEARTICGSPTTRISENSLAAAFGFPSRYGHLTGNRPGNHPADILTRSTVHGICGDLEMALHRLTPPRLIKEYKLSYDHLELDLPVEHARATRRALRRKLRDPSTDLELPSAFRRTPPVCLTPPMRNAAKRIEALARIQTHLLDHGIDTSALIPPTPALEEGEVDERH